MKQQLACDGVHCADVLTSFSLRRRSMCGDALMLNAHERFASIDRAYTICWWLTCGVDRIEWT